MKLEVGQLTVNDRIAIGKAASFLRFQAAYSVDATESARQEWRSIAEALTDIERRCQAQPAEDPDEWVVQDRVPVRVGDRISWHYDNVEDSVEAGCFSVGAKHGDISHGDRLRVWCRRRDLPKVEQVKTDAGHDWSYHEKQKPQPKKTMLRLWVDRDCNVHAGLKGDRDLELHYDHETRQFYTEEPS